MMRLSRRHLPYVCPVICLNGYFTFHMTFYFEAFFQPLLEGSSVKSPMFSNLLTRNFSSLHDFVERGFRDSQVRGNLVER